MTYVCGSCQQEIEIGKPCPCGQPQTLPDAAPTTVKHPEHISGIVRQVMSGMKMSPTTR